MFLHHIKKLGLVVCAAALCSCGLFSKEKELPRGTRLAVLSSDQSETVKPLQIPTAEIPAAVTNPDWTQTGGNSVHVMENLSARHNMQKVWSASCGKGNSKRNLLLAQPVIYDNIVFAQDVNATVTAIGFNDGKKIWKQKLKPTRPFENESGLNGAGLAVDDNAVYAAAGFGSVFALNRKTGDIKWRKDLNTPLRIAPALCGSKVLIQTLDNRIFALNNIDGQELWRYNISAEDTVLAGGASPACSLEKNLVTAGFSNGEIQAFNADIGYPLWSTMMVGSSSFNSSTEINAIKGSPVIDGENIYAVGHNDLTAALDFRTGEKKWERKIGGVNLPWIAGNYIFLLTNTNEVYALNKNSGQTLWSVSLLNEYDLKERADIYLSGPVMINGQLLITASNGVVYALSPQSGAVLNKLELDSGIPISPVAAENSVVFVSDKANLIVYK